MRVVALAGGTGGAKLAAGLQSVLSPGDLTVVVNTGDDIERHGLLVMPDHDAVFYMLTGRFDHERGWGVVGETWTVMDALAAYGEESWFRLGDHDFATHIARGRRLREGRSLTAAVRELQVVSGLRTAILPMSDSPVRTQLRTDDGWLDFQEYFVHRRQAPDVHEVRYAGIEDARATAEVGDALDAADVIVIGPSNPIVSIGPILTVPGVRMRLAAAQTRGVPIVAMSPIIGGKALKGPADRMLTSLGHDSTAAGVARLYAGLADGFIADSTDEAALPAIAALGPRATAFDTIMAGDAATERVAREVLAFAATLTGHRSTGSRR